MMRIEENGGFLKDVGVGIGKALKAVGDAFSGIFDELGDLFAGVAEGAGLQDAGILTWGAIGVGVLFLLNAVKSLVETSFFSAAINGLIGGALVVFAVGGGF